MVLQLDLLDPALFPIVDFHQNRVEHRHAASGVFVEVLAHAVLQHGRVHNGIRFGHADALEKVADRSGRIPAPAHAAERRHPRVVPTGDEPFLDETAQIPLAHDGVRHVEARKLDLARL
jgi:hypothetical protein